MRISFIAAIDKNYLIGLDNDLPWSLPDDLKFFKKNTAKKTVVMGRKTFDSLNMPNGLPNRKNIVLSKKCATVGLSVECMALDDFLSQYQSSEEEIMVIGGGNIYAQLLEHVTTIYLTSIDTEIAVTDCQPASYFPRFNQNDFHMTWQAYHPKDSLHAYSFSFMVFQRSDPSMIFQKREA